VSLFFEDLVEPLYDNVPERGTIWLTMAARTVLITLPLKKTQQLVY
jgi:hypothetical protein